MDKPLLLVDVDGVISLFGFDPARRPDGRFELVDGIAHFLSATAGATQVRPAALPDRFSPGGACTLQPARCDAGRERRAPQGPGWLA